jgi:hypothetical protein
MGKEHHVPSVGNHSQGCKEDGVDRSHHGLQGFVFISTSLLISVPLP